MAQSACDLSVVIPVHNRADLLPGALRVAFGQQTDVRYEVIVVDDCSTDGSAEVAVSLGARTLRLQTNVGPGASRDAGIAVAKGTWIAFLDSDDRWAPDHLATLWAARRDVGLVASTLVSSDGGHPRIVGGPLPWRRTLRRPADILRPENVIPTSATLVKRDLIIAAGGFAPGAMPRISNCGCGS